MFLFAISGILLVVVVGGLSWVSIQRQAAMELFLNTLYNNESMDEERHRPSWKRCAIAPRLS